MERITKLVSAAATAELLKNDDTCFITIPLLVDSARLQMKRRSTDNFMPQYEDNKLTCNLLNGHKNNGEQRLRIRETPPILRSQGHNESGT